MHLRLPRYLAASYLCVYQLLAPRYSRCSAVSAFFLHRTCNRLIAAPFSHRRPPCASTRNTSTSSDSGMGSFWSLQQQRHQHHQNTMLIPTQSSRSATSGKSEYTNNDNDGNGDISSSSGRPLPDFSAFAYDPAVGMRVPPSSSSESKEEAVVEDSTTTSSAASRVTRSGSKRTRRTNASAGKDIVDEDEVAEPSPSKRAKKASTPPISKSKSKSKSTPKAKTPKKSPGGSGRKRTPKIEPGSLPPPRNWEDTWDLVYELRQDRSAPVDTDGGHALPQRDRGEKVYRFQVLVALMLSSQTKDAVVGTTMRSLQEYGLDVETIHGTSAQDLNALINKVGFHNNKTKYLKQTCEILLAKYDGDIPSTAAEMMELPGVGPKMAYIVESIVYDKTTGVGVDTHMHRMFNVLKWVNSKTPEKTREQLEGWLPRDRWSTVNVLWVGIGQETQQQKEKIIKKAIASSRPADALGLIRKLGVDLVKEGKRYGLEEEIKSALLGDKRGGK